MPDTTPTKTYCPICERPIKTNARGLRHRHKAGTDHHTPPEVCPGSGQPAVDEVTIIAAANQRRREALRQMTRSPRAYEEGSGLTASSALTRSSASSINSS